MRDRIRRVGYDTDAVRVVGLLRDTNQTRGSNRRVGSPGYPVLSSIVLKVRRLCHTRRRLGIRTRIDERQFRGWLTRRPIQQLFIRPGGPGLEVAISLDSNLERLGDSRRTLIPDLKLCQHTRGLETVIVFDPVGDGRLDGSELRRVVVMVRVCGFGAISTGDVVEAREDVVG